MQTLQSLKSLAGTACLLALLNPGEAIAVDLSTATACHDSQHPRARLACYDEVTGYIPDVMALAQRETETPPPKTRYGRFLDDLFSAQTAATPVRLTVIDPTTGATMALAEEGSDTFEALLKSDPKEHDLYLTIIGRETGVTAGEARLVLACEHDITQMIVLWNDALKAGDAPARFYTDDRTTDPLRTTMRVIDNGHATRAPRGLEAIALLRVLRRHSRLQIAVDQDTEETRSALFDIDGLDRYLRPLSKRCGWS